MFMVILVIEFCEFLVSEKLRLGLNWEGELCGLDEAVRAVPQMR